MDEASIFLETLQKTAPEERAAYLDQACAGNDELRRNVDMLLKAHAKAGDFLNQAPAEVRATADQPLAERPGTVIGPYKLLQEIGEGGFGVVFMAEQTQPVRRKVALKVLKPGMDTRQVVARFEAERQALAIMDHPNIAKVFDGGSTEESEPRPSEPRPSEPRPLGSGPAEPLPYGRGSGRPYFVMELVKGVPITEFCDQNHLTPRQRLELFIPVCQAVQHAHQKGIIHRDLKPSNILVTVHDTTPVPKVIDFGVAKALGQELTDKTLFTGFAQMVGTPLYMSPEQAGQSGLDIDTRSDIYSLGVLLYELLTGTTPFDKERFKQAAYDEIRRIIREEEPPKPSTRLSDTWSAERGAQSAESGTPNGRGASRSTLRALRFYELDWIVMKALEKDRNRRYETANGFAMDVQRYLADEPVQACPPSAAYRFRKFTRRNKAALTMASVVAVALLLVIAVGADSMVQRERQLRDVSHSVRESLVAARAAIEAKHYTLARRKLAEADGLITTVRGELSSLSSEIEQLVAHVELHIEANKRFAQFRKLVEEFQSLSLSLDWHHQGSAYDRCQEALRLYGAEGDFSWTEQPAVRKLCSEHSAELRDNVFELLVLLADWRVHGPGKQPQPQDYRRAIELLTRAETFCAPTRSLYERRSACWTALGKDEAACADAARAAATGPGLALDHYLLGEALRRKGQLPKAVDEFSQAVRLKPNHFPSLFRIGWCLMRLERAPEAEIAFTACIALQPDSPHPYQYRALVCAKQGKEQQALDDYQKAADRGDYLAFLHRGLLHAQHGRSAEAIADYSKAIELNATSYTSYHNRGAQYARLGEYDKALADFNKAIGLNPSLPDLYCNRAILYARHKHPQEALADFQKVLELHPKFVRAYHCRACLVWMRVGQFPKAIEDLTKAIELERANPDHYRHRAGCYTATKDFNRALEDYSKVVELKAKRASSYLDRAIFFVRQGHYRKALADADRAVSHAVEPPSKYDYYNAACVCSLASAVVGKDEKQAKRQELAREYAHRAIELLREAVAKGYDDLDHLAKDADLEAVRQHPGFAAVVQEMKSKRRPNSSTEPGR